MREVGAGERERQRERENNGSCVFSCLYFICYSQTGTRRQREFYGSFVTFVIDHGTSKQAQ